MIKLLHLQRKSFYESLEHDLFGVLGNLILLAISDKNNLSPAQIKELLANKINFNLPEDVLRTILKRLRRDGLVEYSDIKKPKCYINKAYTEQGKNQEKTVRENYKSADREKQSILTSLKNKDCRIPQRFYPESLICFWRIVQSKPFQF